MSTSQGDDHVDAAEPQQVRCSDTELTVTSKDGRKITTPLWWYPRLLRATPQQRSNYELSPFGVHWPEIDEDLSVVGMLRGAKAPGAKRPEELHEPLERGLLNRDGLRGWPRFTICTRIRAHLRLPRVEVRIS
jgi:Protein of unknown function (DUF2442)